MPIDNSLFRLSNPTGRNALNRTMQSMGQAGLREPPYGPHDNVMKGRGWLGELMRPDGGTSSELSASAEIDGQEVSFPLMVPSLTVPEINYLLSAKGGDPNFYRHPLGQSIMQKATSHALERMRAGTSPFAD